VVGSAIFSQDDYHAALRRLEKAVNLAPAPVGEPAGGLAANDRSTSASS
jgi:hypothetical protein